MPKSDLNSTIKNFFTGNKLDKEKFRSYVYDNFKSTFDKLDKIIRTPEFKNLIRNLNDYCVVVNNKECKQVIIGIKNLPQTIKNWIKDNVEDINRFEFTVMTKAAEISSGDHDYDYYYALMIRHDQLLAATQVFRTCLVNIRTIIKVSDPKDIIDKSAFTYFSGSSFDDKIYLYAQDIFDTRKQLGII